MRKTEPQRVRVCLGLVEVAGYYENLRLGFQQIGVACTLLDLGDHAFAYGRGDIPRLLTWLRSAGRRRGRASGRGWLRFHLWRATYRALKLLLFVWAVVRHDAFVFGYRSTFFRFRELPLLRWLGKRVIYVFHGSDARPPYLDGSVMAMDRGRSIEDCIAVTRDTKEEIRIISRHADVLVCTGAYGHFLEREFVQGLALGLPYNRPQPSRRSDPARDGKVVRILHAPSHPEAKGTALIRAAVARLRERGHAVELVEVVGQPNAVVLEQLEACDLVVDQAYSDTPLAGFATEAAAFGKPSVVGSYAREETLRSTPASWVPPSEFVHPDAIDEAILRLVADRTYREELGARARHFVEARWSQRLVAERYLRLIRDDIPPEWHRDPRGITYLHGALLSEERAQALVRAVVAAGGREALQLADKPALEQALIDFAATGTGPPQKPHTRVPGPPLGPSAKISA